jgi:hypothetical protein
MDKRYLVIGFLIAAIVAVSVMTLALPAGAQDKTAPAAPGSADIVIDNGIINITFGENESYAWFFGGENFIAIEQPSISYGTHDPLPLNNGKTHQCYPSLGDPDTWYEAIISLDLDGDEEDDVNVTRAIMVPSGEKYFVVRYCIESIHDLPLDNLTLFQGVDYDIGPNFDTNIGGYEGGAVYVEDRKDLGMVAGFFGNRSSSHHSVDFCLATWYDIGSGMLDDTDYYEGDVGVALQWDLGDLYYDETTCLDETFFFDYLPAEEAPAFTPTGIIALVSLLSATAAVAIVRKRR